MAEQKKKFFSDLIRDSWNEYKYVWKVFLIILILFSFIPSIFVNIFQYLFESNYQKLGGIADVSQILPIFFKYYIPLLIFSLIVFILSIWTNSSFIFNSIYRKKEMGVKESLKGGKKYFWKFLGLTLLLLLIIGVPIFILAIIGGLLSYFNVSIAFMVVYWIIFIFFVLFIIWISVCWLFSCYILIAENKRIVESLKLSKKLVNGKWWKTFGYILLFTIIIGLVALIIGLISLLINYIINPQFFNPAADMDSDVYRINLLISFIFNFIITALITPFGVLFLKNFYISKKTEMKKIS